MKRWQVVVLALGYAGLWVLVLCAVVASYGYVQHNDELAEAAAQRQLSAAAVVELGAPGQ